MKQYADRKENLIYQKHEILNDVLRTSLLKSLAFEKALKTSNKKTA